MCAEYARKKDDKQHIDKQQHTGKQRLYKEYQKTYRVKTSDFKSTYNLADIRLRCNAFAMQIFAYEVVPLPCNYSLFNSKGKLLCRAESKIRIGELNLKFSSRFLKRNTFAE